MTYFPLRQTTCFFIPLVAPCKLLLTWLDTSSSQVILFICFMFKSCQEIGVIAAFLRRFAVKAEGRSRRCYKHSAFFCARYILASQGRSVPLSGASG